MSKGLAAKLRREIERRGFVAPILVRPRGEAYQVVDGEHRFTIARELGHERVPCVVVEMDHDEARMKTLQMNGLRGTNDPEALAALLAELAESSKPEALARRLPFSALEIDQMIELAKADAGKRAGEFASGFRAPAPRLELLVFLASPAQAALVGRALDATGAADRTEALCRLCERFLDGSEGPADEIDEGRSHD